MQGARLWHLIIISFKYKNTKLQLLIHVARFKVFHFLKWITSAKFKHNQKQTNISLNYLPKPEMKPEMKWITILEAQIQIPCHINKNESTNVTLTGTYWWKQHPEGVHKLCSTNKNICQKKFWNQILKSYRSNKYWRNLKLKINIFFL
jgi:hypothetical protein